MARRLSSTLAGLAALAAGAAIFTIARLRSESAPGAAPSIDRRMPLWGAALLGLALLAAAVIVGPEYVQLRSETLSAAKTITGGDPARAPWLLIRYGCAGCHTIPGVPGADGKVGPPLRDLFARVYIGGVADNQAANLIGWITDPTRFSPHTAMPPTGISISDSRDIAAYLYSH